MKKLIVVANIVFSCFIVVISGVGSPAHAAKPTQELLQGKKLRPLIYLGDHCWIDSTGAIFKLGITHVGGGHFFVGGRFIVPDPEPQELPEYGLQGGLEVILGEIHMNLTSSTDYDDEAGLITFFIRLDPQTLDGNYKGVEIWSDVSNINQGMEYFSDTLQAISCPIAP